VNMKDIRRLPLVGFPPLDTQKKLGHLIAQYDELIANNQRRITLLEEAARLLYREWFVHNRYPGHEHVRVVDGIPDGWRRMASSEAFEVNPPTARTDEGTVTYVPMAALSEVGMIVDPGLLEQRQQSTSVRFKNGDTLLARITPCLENGKTAFVQFLRDDEVACGSTEFIVLRGRHVSSSFVYLTARQPSFRENAVRSMIGSSGRQRVQPSCFDRYYVAIPPTSLAVMFDEAIIPMFQQIRNLDQQNQRLMEARDLLLPELMKGNITV
jgi:type I restriction enzyme S subunit